MSNLIHFSRIINLVCLTTVSKKEFFFFQQYFIRGSAVSKDAFDRLSKCWLLKNIQYCVERKRHLHGNRCMGIPQESTKHKISIIKKGDVCWLCNAEIKHGTIKVDKKTCKKQPKQTIFTSNVCPKEFSYKSIQGPFLAVTTV